MQMQRYLFTAVLSTLMWPLSLWCLGNPLVELMRLDYSVGLYLEASLFLATIAGVWSVDATMDWSAGKTPLFGGVAVATHAGIAVIAATVFSIPYSSLITVLSGQSFSYLDALLGQGIIVLGIVWIATQIVDVLKRDYGPRNPIR